MSVLTRRLGALAARLSSPLRRGYGSAAAQLDYDYYYSYDAEEEPEAHRRGMEESDGWETPGRGVQWVIMGDPLVRRHVYAHRLSKLLEVPHISMGSLVRQELNPTSPLYKKIADAVNQGKLVPEDVIFGLLSKRLEEGYCRGETGFILDGIPRTAIQAEILDEIADIDLVLNLKCKDGIVVKKTNLESGIYSPCQELNPMASLSAKSDAMLKEKLGSMYTEQMKGLEEYYKQQKKLVNFQVAGAPGDTWEGLLAALQLQHMTANSSHKLTA
ncbi:probable adenylate kinase 7, mitochondrial [Salvia miltiorrhiza]|uniref:probable adenylate kinase 7, mitochondrial n=1 Tax=Salvia miltiorrhiza TaxID=226208 RepID=UPI0025AC0865|nr:probable adenylate kinase 7, mitochondrial [Salvia miltiorrhiza]